MEKPVTHSEDNLKHEINHIWDAGATGYDKQYAHGLHSAGEKQAWLAALREIAGPGPLNIADIGSGTGFLALLLAELGHVVQAFDLSDGMMEIGRQKATQEKLKIEFKTGDAENLPLPDGTSDGNANAHQRPETGDAENLPLPDGTVDLAINRHVLWTLPHPVAALKEWKRITKPGGRVIVIDGLWGLEGSLPQKLQKQAGKALMGLQKRLSFSTPKSEDERRTHRYTPQVMQQLPAMRLQSYQEVLALFGEAGLTDATLSYLSQVDVVEREAMPFANRLASSSQRHYVITASVDH